MQSISSEAKTQLMKPGQIYPFPTSSCVVFVHFHLTTALCQTLANLGQDGLVLDVIFVICLEFSGNTVQGALESIFRGGVHHLGLIIETS